MGPLVRRSPLLLALATWLAVPGAAAAADKVRAFRAARVYVTPQNVLAPGWLIVKSRTVEAVLPGTESPPAGAEVIDLGDAVVLPGFVNPLSSISDRAGRAESGVASGGGGGPRDSRALVASAALQKPDAAFLRRLGRTGYGALAWIPDANGFLPGHPAVLHPRVGTEKEAAALIIKDAPYLLLGFDMGKRWRDAVEGELKKAAEAIAKEAEAKRQAEEARKKAEEAKAAEAKKAAEPGGPEKKDAEKKEPEKKEPEKKDAPPPAPAAPPAAAPPAPPAPPKPPDPLVKVLKGETPLFVRVRSLAALDHFFRILETAGVKPRFTLVTGALSPEGVEKVAARRELVQAVVLEPRVESIPTTSVLASTARGFIERGLPVAFVPLADSIEGHAEMPLRLAEAIKAGVPAVDALGAVTTVPARLLGLEGKIGTLEKGAAASFAVYRGEPLGGAARLEIMYVEGTEVFRDDGEKMAVSGEAVR